ncbi:MAG: haloalkane dehalogenase [Anaerolineae bacterium]
MAAETISADFPFESCYLEVFGSRMHYIDEGEGDPILFLHGNPTSSYLWRNVIPHLTPYGRCLAVDLIGMGKSDKPNLDYRFVTHSRYLEAFIEQLGLKNVALVLHDWGSGLGFHYARRHEDNIKGIAFMEAITRPSRWADAPLMMRLLFKRFRHPKKGWRMNAKKNFFVRRMLPMMVSRKLTAAEKAAYTAPYPDEQSRKPVTVWPREIPFDGEPADVHEIVSAYHAWLQTSHLPKLLLWAKPGAIIAGETAARQIQSEFPQTEAVFVGKGRHYIQEDHPHEIGRAIVDWYQKL